MSVLVYHPGTQAQLVVDEGQLVHMRISGWLTQAEHDANTEPAPEAPEAASKPAAQAAKTEK